VEDLSTREYVVTVVTSPENQGKQVVTAVIQARASYDQKSPENRGSYGSYDIFSVG
jgi:hypothetical protein